MQAKQREDFFSLYLKRAGVGEVSPVLHRWGALMTIAVLVSRRVYFRFGTGKIFPNMYLVFMGESASKKSTAINNVAKVLRLAGFDRFAPGETSKGKFAMHLAGIEDLSSITGNASKRQTVGGILDKMEAELKSVGKPKAVPKELISESFICAGELANFLGFNNIDFASFLGDMWDRDEPYEVSYKVSGEFKIHNPLINLLGGNTFEGMMKTLPPDLLGQGFLSRCIFIHSPKTGRKIAFPTGSTLKDDTEFLQYLNFFQSLEGEIKMSEEAKIASAAIYDTWQDLDDHRFKQYSGRRFTQLLKLCTLEAIAQRRVTITYEDVVRANTWLTYTEANMPRALGEYGAGRNATGSNAIMNIFYNNPTLRLKVEQLWERTSSAFDSFKAGEEAIAGLLVAKKLQHDNAHLMLGKQFLLKSSQYVKYELFKPDYL